MAQLSKENVEKKNNFYIYNGKTIDSELVGIEKNGTFSKNVPEKKKSGILALSQGGKNFHFTNESQIKDVKFSAKKTENGYYFTYKKV